MEIVHINQPPTREERGSIAFEPSPLFEGTNEAWARAHLPHIRVASIFLNQPNRAALREMIRDLWEIDDGDAVAETLEHFTRVRDHLKALTNLLETASLRAFLVLEDLGHHDEDHVGGVS